MRRALAFLRTGRGLPAFAALTLVWMVLVALEGAVVRATGSGAGCGAHWPLCNGQILPHHPRLATVIEFTHRCLTGVCTGLTVALLVWTFLARPRGARVRKAASWSGVLLLTEGLLGAVLVLGHFVEHNTSNMRVLVQGVHFTNTLLLLGALSLAWWWQRPRSVTLPTSTNLRGVAVLALFSLLLTGATGSVAALADTLFPSPDLHTALLADFAQNSPLLIRMRWVHPAASFLAVGAIGWLAFRIGGRSRGVLLSLLGAQVVLGIADVLLLAPIPLQVLHLLAADVLWTAVILVSAEIALQRTGTVAPARPTPLPAHATQAA